MNILILTKYFPPEVGAASHLFYELAESLVGYGHKVTVLTGFPTYNVNRDNLPGKYKKGVYLQEEMSGINVRRLREVRMPSNIRICRGLDHFIIAFNTLFQGIFTGNQDIILIYSPPLTIGISAYILSKIKKVPFVVNVQDLFPQNAVDLGLLNSKFLIKAFESIEKFIYEKSDFITVHSEGNKEHIVDKGGDRNRIKVLPNWVDTEFIKPQDKKNDFSKKYNLDNNYVVSFAGTMGYSQDIDIILEAARNLQDEEDIKFILVGDGVEKERLVEKRDVMNVNNVEFIPMQPREKYPQVLYASDISLVTLKKSVETPVVPSKILSIMSSGTPVVASMNLRGDAPELIKKSDCGIVVEAENSNDFTEAIMEIYKNDKIKREKGIKGRQYAVNYLSRRVCTKKYERIFNKLREAKNEGIL